jgi:hypothetical protein
VNPIRLAAPFAFVSLLGACDTHGTIGVLGDARPPAADGSRIDSLCPELGWCELLGTSIDAVCPEPSPGGVEGCAGVVSYSGGAADTSENRLLVWGGGTTNYWGNELYALDLISVSMQRLTDPSPIDPSGATLPSETYPDGRPSARSTYDNLVYVGGQHRMLSFDGDLASTSNGLALASDAIWAFELATREWTRLVPSAPIPASYGVIAEYDPTTRSVYAVVGQELYRYDVETRQVELLRDFEAFSGEGVDYHMLAVVDPKRQRLYLVGGKARSGDPETPGGFKVVELAPGAPGELQDWTADADRGGCAELLEGTNPGVAYEPVLDRVVGWSGGDRVILFDPETRSCETRTFPGAPTPHATGTYGRFRYFPALGVFAVVNLTKDNAFVLRIRG